MSMGRNKAIPLSTREYPEYTYREFPKVVGVIDGLGNVVTKMPKPGEDSDGLVTLVAFNKDHEVQLRNEYPDLPVFVPPPSSLSMTEMKANMTELAMLREENKRLKLQVGGVEVLPPEALRPKVEAPLNPAPVAAEVDRSEPGTDMGALAAGEDPKGDPWAGLPENDIPAQAGQPAIKPAGTPPRPPSIQSNKLRR